MGLERQGGGLQHQVENPHKGKTLHPLLQNVSTLSDGESDDNLHWLKSEQTHRVLQLLPPQRRLASVKVHLCKYFILVLKTVLCFCNVTNHVIFCIILMSVEQSIRNLWSIKLKIN